jgi:hypothetical protein
MSTTPMLSTASRVRWRIEQAQAFREQVEHYTDAERVILADAYQALLRYWPLPDLSSPLVIHRFRDPRAGDAYALVLPWSWSAIRCSATPSWSRRPTSSATGSCPDRPTRPPHRACVAHMWQSLASRGLRSNKPTRPIRR